MSVPLHVWVSIHHLNLLHKFKIMTSLDAFFIFSKFWFSGLFKEMEGWAISQKWSKMTVSLCISGSQELYFIWLWFLVHIYKMMISPVIFFIFSKFWFFWVFQSSSVNAKRKFWGVPHLLHMCLIFVSLKVIKLYPRSITVLTVLGETEVNDIQDLPSLTELIVYLCC